MKSKSNLFMLVCFITIISIFAFRPASEPTKWQYCTITAYNSFLSSKARVLIDYGQEKGNRNKRANRIKDDQGNPLVFNTAIDALNYMGQDGWKCVSAYNPDSARYTQFLLRKPAD